MHSGQRGRLRRLTDAGCLMNIGGRMHREAKATELLHIAELLDRR